MTHREKRPVKPLNSTGIIHNLAQGLQTPVFPQGRRDVGMFYMLLASHLCTICTREGRRAGGRAGVGVYKGGGEEEKSCYNFKSIIPGSQPLY